MRDVPLLPIIPKKSKGTILTVPMFGSDSSGCGVMELCSGADRCIVLGQRRQTAGEL
jgi:hypothetical protein